RRLVAFGILRCLFFRFRLRLGLCDLGPQTPLRLARFGLPAEPGDRAPSLFDLLARALGEVVRADGELLREIAVAEDLQVVFRVPDQAGRSERLGRDLGPGVEPLEVANIDGDRVRAVWAHRHRVLRVRATL